MKKLCITLLLFTPFTFAGWGDVYYCDMTGHLVLDNKGNLTRYKLEKFKFKLDKKKEALVFGEVKSIPSIIWIDTDISRPKSEYFKFALGEGLFVEGRFMYSFASSDEIHSVTADCTKF
jgi:hypothetical protein